jgi:hypothetical protein
MMGSTQLHCRLRYYFLHVSVVKEMRKLRCNEVYREAGVSWFLFRALSH